MPLTAEIWPRYTRADPRGQFPTLGGGPGIACSRLAAVWRPMIDMADGPLAPLSLRMIPPVSHWIATGPPGPCWFSRIAVPGLRRQVLLHAGLPEYDVLAPGDLPAGLQSPAWQHLVGAIGCFGDLDALTRSLVVFQLAQLTFSRFATGLTGLVKPTGDPAEDHYAYEVARLHACALGPAADAMPVFEALATEAGPVMAYHACFQGIGRSIRRLRDLSLARRFAALAAKLPGLGGDWTAHMALSRYHRALALLWLVDGELEQAAEELRVGWHQHQLLIDLTGDDETARMIADENLRYLLEMEVQLARNGAVTSATRLRECASRILSIDPNAVEARLNAGDGYLAAGDLATAAAWYARAGELGTSAGAVGWYRAGQCYDHLGDYDNAVNAMGHCLALDTTAIEPRNFLEERG